MYEICVKRYPENEEDWMTRCFCFFVLLFFFFFFFLDEVFGFAGQGGVFS